MELGEGLELGRGCIRALGAGCLGLFTEKVGGSAFTSGVFGEGAGAVVGQGGNGAQHDVDFVFIDVESLRIVLRPDEAEPEVAFGFERAGGDFIAGLLDDDAQILVLLDLGGDWGDADRFAVDAHVGAFGRGGDGQILGAGTGGQGHQAKSSGKRAAEVHTETLAHCPVLDKPKEHAGMPSHHSVGRSDTEAPPPGSPKPASPAAPPRAPLPDSVPLPDSDCC